jgi:hypothetical protein
MHISQIKEWFISEQPEKQMKIIQKPNCDFNHLQIN